jgi:hypothetical protein
VPNGRDGDHCCVWLRMFGWRECGDIRDRERAVIVCACVAVSLVKDLFSGYRPELHYVRGPGPKWRTKHQPWLKFDF